MRGHALADLAGSAAMWADPAVVRHITGKPSTPEESWSRLLRYGGLWTLLGFGYWLVEEREVGPSWARSASATSGASSNRPSTARRRPVGFLQPGRSTAAT